eukprot:362854-Chlamydomonas_euryale.AAC.6
MPQAAAKRLRSALLVTWSAGFYHASFTAPRAIPIACSRSSQDGTPRRMVRHDDAVLLHPAHPGGEQRRLSCTRQRMSPWSRSARDAATATAAPPACDAGPACQPHFSDLLTRAAPACLPSLRRRRRCWW